MLRRPALPLLACMLCALCAIAAGALAADDGGPSDAISADSTVVRTALERAQEEQRAAAEYRSSDAGRAERDASQGAFANQADDQALATARKEFPGLVSSPPLQWPALGPGQQVDRYLSPESAVVEGTDGRRALLESSLPLRGETPDGARAPLDMGVSDEGSSFEPKSTTEPLSLPDNSTGELRFPDQHLGIGLAGADPSDARVTSGKLFYANAVRDGDLTLEPTPDGAEISLLLRSPDSPSDPQLQFDLPAGAELRLAAEPGAAEVVRDGQRLALIAPASAVDAQGKQIGVSYGVDGDRLAMHVADGGDVAWPVLVDPTTYVYDNNGQSVAAGSTGYGWPGWNAVTNRPTSNTPGCPSATTGVAYTECKKADGSLLVQGFAGMTYGAYDYGAFQKKARSGTYIYSLQAGNTSNSARQSFEFAGICGKGPPTCTGWLAGHWWTPLDKATGTAQSGTSAFRMNGAAYAGEMDYYCYDPSAAAPSQACPLTTGPDAASFVTDNAVEWGLTSNGVTPVYAPSAAMGSAATLSADNSAPKIAWVYHSNAPSAGWVQSYSDTAQIRPVENGGAIDNGYTYGSDTNVNGDHLQGVGLGTATLTGPGVSSTQSAGCSTTTDYDNCPQILTFPGVTYTAPEGTSTYTASATDVVGNAGPGQSWTVQVDSHGPNGSFTNVPTYTNGTAHITGTMTDALSGPQDAKVQYQAPGSTAWVDACPRQLTSDDFTCDWSTTGLADGTYKVRAELRDKTATPGPNVGYAPDPTGVNIVVDHTGPALLTDVAPAVGSNEYDDKVDDSGMTETDFVQHDTLSGVAQTTLDYNSATDGSANGQWVAADAAPAVGDGATSTIWGTAGVPDGLHQVRATTTDKAGNPQYTYFRVLAPTKRVCGSADGCYVGFAYGVPKAPPRTGARPACVDPTALFADPVNGNDANRGTSEAPFKTLRMLADSLNAQSPTGCLKGGTYRVNDASSGGSPSGGFIANSNGLKPMTIQNVPGQVAIVQGYVKVDGANVTLRGLNLNSRNLEATGCPWVKTADNKCGAFSPEISGDNDQLIESDVTSEGNATDIDTQTNCIVVKHQAADVVIKNNVIHNCGYPVPAVEQSGGHWHGIYVTTGVRTQISYNIFYGNGDRAIQLYPAATGVTIDHNTLDDNGFGINIGGAKEGTADCPATTPSTGDCWSDHTEVTANIVTDSRAGHDSRYIDQATADKNIYSYNIANDLQATAANHIRATNCTFLTYNGRSGVDTSPGGPSGDFYWENLTVANPLYANAAQHDYTPRNARCAGYGAVPTTYHAYGIRDRMTTPTFSGTATGYTGTTAAIAARLHAPFQHRIETGVTNKAPCVKSQSSDWIVYVSWDTAAGRQKVCVKKKLASGVEKPYSAVITRGNRDIVDAPGLSGTKRVIIDQRNNKWAPTGGTVVDAFARTFAGGAKVGGSWTGVSFLASRALNAQGAGDWRVPTFGTSSEITSFEQGFHYAPYGSTTPYASFCAYGPNQTGC